MLHVSARHRPATQSSLGKPEQFLRARRTALHRIQDNSGKDVQAFDPALRPASLLQWAAQCHLCIRKDLVAGWACNSPVLMHCLPAGPTGLRAVGISDYAGPILQR